MNVSRNIIPGFSYLVILFFVTLSMILFVYLAVNYGIDPYGENAICQGSWNQKKMGQSAASVGLLTKNLDQKPFTLIFGTSRSHLLGSKLLGQPVLNLVGIYGHPRQILRYLQFLNERRLANISRVYYLLDVHTLSENEYIASYDYQASWFEHNSFLLRQTNGDKILDAWRTLEINIRLLGQDFEYYIEGDGSLVYIDPNRSFDKRNYQAFSQPTDPQEASPQSLKALKNLHQFCQKHGLAITFFSPTFPDFYLQQINLSLIENNWRQILQNIPQILGLLYVEGISNRHNQGIYTDFSNPTHLNASASRLIFHRVIEKADDKRFVNHQQVSEYFHRLRLVLNGIAMKN